MRHEEMRRENLRDHRARDRQGRQFVSLVPVRHVTIRHSRVAASRASALTTMLWMPCANRGRVRGRPLPTSCAGATSGGVATKTFRLDDTPNAYGNFAR